MKTTLNLTYEDGLKVVEAMKDVATKYDWTDEEIAKLDIIEQYTSAVDAALAAMGISVSIAGEPGVEDDDFDDEEWDEDEEDGYFDSDEEEEEDDDTTTYSLTPKDEFVLRYLEAGHTFEEAYEIADLLFGKGE